MRTKLLYVFLCCFFVCGTNAQESWNIFLLDNWKSDTLLAPESGLVYSNCIGFAQNGEEYAVVGSTEGTHIFHIDNGSNLLPVAFIEGRFSDTSVIHRDYVYHNNLLYAVCGEGHSSLQIIDMQYLPDSVEVLVDNDTIMGRVNSLYLDTNSSLLYACTFTAVINNPTDSTIPMKVFSLADSLQPVEVYAGPSDVDSVSNVVVLSDTAYLNCGNDGLRIYDFSDSTNPYWIGSLSSYPNQGFNFSGSLSPYEKVYYFTDQTKGKRIKKVDVSDPVVPQILNVFGTNYENGSAPHKIVISKQLIYVSYNNEGVRVYDSRYEPPKEIANYNTNSNDDTSLVNGAWGIDVSLPSGRILVSDRKEGLFLLSFDALVFNLKPPKGNFVFYPNPSFSGQKIVFRLKEDDVSEIEFNLFDKFGRNIFSKTYYNQDYWIFHDFLGAGTYAFSIQYKNSKGEDSYHYGQLLILGKQ